MIGRLYKADVLPRTITTALHTVRELGNLGSHHHEDEDSWDAAQFVPPSLLEYTHDKPTGSLSSALKKTTARYGL